MISSPGVTLASVGAAEIRPPAVSKHNSSAIHRPGQDDLTFMMWPPPQTTALFHCFVAAFFTWWS